MRLDTLEKLQDYTNTKISGKVKAAINETHPTRNTSNIQNQGDNSDDTVFASFQLQELTGVSFCCKTCSCDLGLCAFLFVVITVVILLVGIGISFWFLIGFIPVQGSNGYYGPYGGSLYESCRRIDNLVDCTSRDGILISFTCSTSNHSVPRQIGQIGVTKCMYGICDHMSVNTTSYPNYWECFSLNDTAFGTMVATMFAIIAMGLGICAISRFVECFRYCRYSYSLLQREISLYDEWTNSSTSQRLENIKVELHLVEASSTNYSTGESFTNHSNRKSEIDQPINMIDNDTNELSKPDPKMQVPVTIVEERRKDLNVN
jgi:hypothetical protein